MVQKQNGDRKPVAIVIQNVVAIRNRIFVRDSHWHPWMPSLPSVADIPLDGELKLL